MVRRGGPQAMNGTRECGTNPRAVKTNPRAHATNPRATGGVERREPWLHRYGRGSMTPVVQTVRLLVVRRWPPSPVVAHPSFLAVRAARLAGVPWERLWEMPETVWRDFEEMAAGDTDAEPP